MTATKKGKLFTFVVVADVENPHPLFQSGVHDIAAILDHAIQLTWQ
jgi:hypothetical protein